MTIILVGVLAIVEAQRGFITSNMWSSHEASATYLASELREMIRRLPRHDPITGLKVVAGVLQGKGPEAGEVLVTDFDDVDDFDGITFGGGGQYAGPINAFGAVIQEYDARGTPVFNPDGSPMPLRGWSQSVKVEKVNPYDFADKAVTWTSTEAASGSFPGRAVDQYPLRVTVTVFYQPPSAGQADQVTAVSWIMP